MDRKDIEDVSAYMLFEATGDSEVDYNPIMDDDVAHEFPRNVVDDDDDDAESCSYDASEICDIGKLNGYESCDGDGDAKNEDEEEKEEEALVYGISYCTDEEHSISKPSAVDSVSEQEVVDEREKNRLFWEACLAS
ncbi:hypothetical protein L6164_034621 [Bauhinia variegata]|uniref:Uncharacterized protein n=1 Tax=Bauhinia variegata TaxID=167791 RepID=A0ACB9KWT0_BAUVA|nr:hypothetical protein L6164_034621 [Bauhinia variegata]